MYREKNLPEEQRDRRLSEIRHLINKQGFVDKELDFARCLDDNPILSGIITIPTRNCVSEHRRHGGTLDDVFNVVNGELRLSAISDF